MKTRRTIKAASSDDYIYVIEKNGEPVAKGTYDAMTKKALTYPIDVYIRKFPKKKFNSLMKMAKDAHRPDPLKFAVNRFINDYTDEYDSLNSSTRVSCSTKRRRVKASRPIHASRRSIKASEWDDNEILRFSELTPEQQQQAVDIFTESTTAFEWYSEDQMYWYEENLKELAYEYSKKYGLTIHEDKLYWESNSQGPYPKWDLSYVFGDIDEESYLIKFYGRGTDVEVDGSIYSQDEDGEWYFDEEFDETDAPEVAKPKIEAAQRFIDEVWDRIESVCRDYPDDEWCYDTLEANDYEFEVDANGDVVGMA